jgi:NMD protein affecting ribosome stability and mRNA decay
MSKKKIIIPEVPQNVKEKFLKDVLLSSDDIQQMAEFDKTFQHDSLQKILLKGFIEWQRSPCEEHYSGNRLKYKITHEICSRCRRIAWEALKG